MKTRTLGGLGSSTRNGELIRFTRKRIKVELNISFEFMEKLFVLTTEGN